MAERAPWIKLWCDYTSTPSHDELDAHTMWVGVVLMLLVRAGNSTSLEETTWALLPTGKPYTVAGIAQRARLPVRTVIESLAALERAGTAAQRDDDAWGLPRFWKFQRSSSTERMARKRKRDEVTSEVTSEVTHRVTEMTEESVTLDVQIASLPRSLRFPDRPTPASGGDTSAPVESAKPKPKPRKPRADYDPAIESALLESLTAACVELGRRGPRAVTPAMRDSLGKLAAACEPTVDEVRHVVAIRAAMDRRGEGYGELSWEHLCRPASFERYRDRPIGAGPKSPNPRGPAPPSPRPLVAERYDRALGRMVPDELPPVSDFLLDIEAEEAKR